jgi:hypothetical protein
MIVAHVSLPGLLSCGHLQIANGCPGGARLDTPQSVVVCAVGFPSAFAEQERERVDANLWAVLSDLKSRRGVLRALDTIDPA